MRNDSQRDTLADRNRQGVFGTGSLRPGRTLGVVMVVAGAILLTLIGGYYAYSVNARSQLNELNFVVAQPAQPVQLTQATQPSLRTQPEVQPPSGSALAQTTSASASTESAPTGSTSAGIVAVATVPSSAISPPQTTQQASPVNQEESARPPSSYTALYPGTHIHPKFWAQPLWSGGEPYVYSPADPGTGLPDGFRAVSALDDALRRGEGALTSRIAIPLIDVDSGTTELAILNLGDSRAYETPKHLVGHIPQSPNPGEIGNGWYFGHLESPIKGEGNVFQRLPEIPDLLRDGDDVFVELEGADGRVFLYRTTRTEVMHQDEFEFYGSDTAQITLVACVPRLVYDHRIVVTAELVGVKDAPDAVN